MEALKREIKKLAALSLFFLIGFGYILLIMKLFLKEYSINTYVLTKAIVGALIAAKSVMIMDVTPLLNRFENSAPRYVSVLYKTAIYTLAVLIIGGIEHLWHAYHRTHEIASAFESFIDSEHFYRLLAVTLCISIVFLFHNIFAEIDSYLGRGSLRKFFLERPKA
jgi:TRAP-type C4-dicarboxylate transport system permease small subunit